MSNPCLLCITVTPALSELVVDWLLEMAPERGFTSIAVAGHGEDQAHYSLAEQIAGRVRRVQFQVLLDEHPAAEALLAALGEAFPRAGIRWWLLPVLAEGELPAPAGAAPPAD